MKSVSRKLALAVLVTLGAAACGDKVTVPPATTTTPRVHSVTVSPSSATVAQGSSFTFGASVDADATLSRAVTWSAAGGTGITVDANGVASASATATGIASICATSTADTGVKGCASLTVAGAAAAATVQIDAITVGCTPLNAALPAQGAGCGLLVPVQTNNAGGQIDVAVIVNRPANSGVTGVKVDVLSGATFSTVEATYTETLTGDFIAQSDSMAAQATTQTNRIVFSIQTAAYSLTGTTATVVHPNGQKKLRASLIGGTQTGQAETQLTFRNANGWHISMGTLANNNGTVCGPVTALAACPVGVNSTTTGLAWKGGTSIPITASPVNYTGFVIAAGSGTTVAFGSVCDLSGVGTRVATNTTVAAGTNGALTGTLNHTANGAGVAAVGTVDGYAIAPGGPCGAAGEAPFAAAVDATGANFINFALLAPFAGNVLNNVLNPVMPTLGTVTPIRLDNAGPAPINGYATGRNPFNGGGAAAGDRCFGLFLNGPNTDGNGGGCPGIATVLQVGGAGPSINNTPQSAFVGGRIGRMNGWMNDAVNFGAIHANSITNDAFLFPATYTAPVAGDANGVISPSATPTGLPIDIGIGGAIAGVPANPITFVARVGACSTVATCAALTTARTTVGAQGAAAALVETNGTNPTGLGALPGYGAIIQTVDVFGNLTNPPVFGQAGFTANFGNVACPVGTPNSGVLAVCVVDPQDANNVYVDNGVLFVGVDRTLPTVVSLGGAGQATLAGTSTRGTTFDNNTIQVTGAANFFYSSDDQIPAGNASTSGIMTTAPGLTDAYISLSRRDGATLQFWCPTNANYQLATTTCPGVTGWAAGTTTYNAGAGLLLSDANASAVNAYYAAQEFTRDKAGNQTTAAIQAAQARDFIFDVLTPVSTSASFSPSPIPANGSLTFNGSATTGGGIDIGRGAFTVRFPSLVGAMANLPAGPWNTAQDIRLAWANKTGTGILTNPTGYNASTATLSQSFSATWPLAIRSIEVVVAGDNGVIAAVPTITAAGVGAANCGAGGANRALIGNVNCPGTITGLATTQGATQPTQYRFFTENVARVGLPVSITNPIVTPIVFAQTGMPNLAGTAAYWSAQQALGLGVSPFFNMAWALINPSSAANLNVAGGGGGGAVPSKTISAWAFGPVGGGALTLTNPFPGGVTFYAIDARQPQNVDGGNGVALVPICGAGTSVAISGQNDQATNTWQFSCAYSPSASSNAINAAYDLNGFHAPNNACLTAGPISACSDSWVSTVNGANNRGLWGAGAGAAGDVNANIGWQGIAAVTAGVNGRVAAGNLVPVIAIGCNLTGNCLATQASLNTGFNIAP